MPPATAASSDSLVPVTRASKPYFLISATPRLRVNGRGAEARRWLDLRDDLLSAVAPGFAPEHLRPDARALLEQTTDLVFQSEFLRARMLSGDDVNPMDVQRLAVATERHLSALKKCPLPKRAAPAKKLDPTITIQPALENLPGRVVVTEITVADYHGRTLQLLLHNAPDDLTPDKVPAVVKTLATLKNVVSRWGRTTEHAGTVVVIDLKAEAGQALLALARRTADQPSRALTSPRGRTTGNPGQPHNPQSVEVTTR